MKVDQAWFGYDAGHGKLAASIELTGHELRVLEGMSDLSGYLDRGQSYEHYDMGYPCGRFYALSRTWPDLANPRPGTVFTHVLLLDPRDVSAITDLAGLDELFRAVPLGERRVRLGAVHAVPGVRPAPEVSSEEARRLVAGWFGSAVRPLLLDVEPRQSVRWLWLRLPRWGRPALSWCTYCLRPRNLDTRPIDLQGIAPGARGAFSQIVVAAPPADLGSFAPLLDARSAAQLWAEAERHGFADANPLMWLRFMEREARAESSYPDALGALDLLAAVPYSPGPQEGLRRRVLDRLLERSRKVGSLRELADLLVRNAERVLPEMRSRVAERLKEVCVTLDPGADPEDVGLLLRSAQRGGYGEVLEQGLELAIERDPGLWTVLWEHLPELATRLWAERRSEDLAARFVELGGAARANVLLLVPEDDQIWRVFAHDPGARERALKVLEQTVSSGADWPAGRRLHLPPDDLVNCAHRWAAPPPRLGAMLAHQLAEGVGTASAFQESLPRWLAEDWLTSEPDQLVRLLRASRALRGIAAKRLPVDRWPLLLDATRDGELLTLDPPEPSVSRWLDRACGLAASAFLRGELDRAGLIRVLTRSPRHEGVARAVTMIAAAQPETAIGLLLGEGATPLRGDRDVVLSVLRYWGHGLRRSPDLVLDLVQRLQAEDRDAWEAGCAGVLAAILERPEPALGDLAAATFPVLHARLCAERGRGWIVRQLEHFWGGYWDRAGKLRDRYAQAWQEGGWPTSNLVSAAGGDEEVLERLGKAVRWLDGGERALEQRRGPVVGRAWKRLR